MLDVLLLEPGYRNKYPPLGLMKLAAFHRRRGDRVTFYKHGFGTLPDRGYSRVYITTLFSFEWKRTAQAINWALGLPGIRPNRVFVGGIAASLVPSSFRREPGWAGIHFVGGLLNYDARATLRLRRSGRVPSDAPTIDQMPPYYGWLAARDRGSVFPYEYPVEDAYFGYASRGCVRKCHFCGVPKLEGEQEVVRGLSKWVEAVERDSGEKRDLLLMDNNVVAAPNFDEIISEILDLGFHRDARQYRTASGRPRGRRLDFNQGIDARIVVRSPHFLRALASTAIKPLRFAFDHLGMRKCYTRAVEMAVDAGIPEISNYMLYNYRDGPDDVYERMRVNRDLHARTGVDIWSFPMRYQPVDRLDRSFVGEQWSWYELRAFQIMLHGTHGCVSASLDYFDVAYGASVGEFRALLRLPLAFIWHRQHYASGAGRPVRDEFEGLWRKMGAVDRAILQEIVGPAGGATGLRARCESALADRKTPTLVRRILPCYMLEATKARDLEVDRGLAARLRTGEAIPDADFPEGRHTTEGAGTAGGGAGKGAGGGARVGGWVGGAGA